MVNISVLAGSTRPGRFNMQPAKWIYKLAKQNNDVKAELIDLAEVGLPFLDEEITPSKGQYQNEHTKKWAERIKKSDGFIFVTPEYNHSYSPALKNAIDFVFAEWHYKPVSFVSYGSLAGGARAVEHLRGVAAEIRLFDLREQILLPNYWDNLNEKGEYQFSEDQEKLANTIIENTAFWAKQMKAAREQLSS